MSKVLMLLCALMIFTACSTSDDPVYMKALDGKWTAKNEQNFPFKINDAPLAKNIIFVVRNNNDYPYSNIRFIVHLKNLKEKKTEVDTLNYILAKPNGEWLGTGFGATKEILFQYKTNYQFPTNGDYEIGIVQAMRKDTLMGIEDIGIKIQTTKP